MTDRPNVLLIVSDQHRARSTGCYDHPTVRTPHIDGIADDGVRFENAFCTSPLCMPSRASLFTGTHPHTNGLVDQQRQKQNPDIDSLVTRFQDAGYRTHGSGYTHIAFDADPLDREHEFGGFDTMGAHYDEYEASVGQRVKEQYRLNEPEPGTHPGGWWPPHYHNAAGEATPLDDDQLFDSYIAREAGDALADLAAGAEPFFHYVGFRAVHPPWLPPQRFLDWYDPADVDLPNWQDPPRYRKPRRLRQYYDYFDIQFYPEELIRQSIAAYHGFVSYMDDCIGRVLDRLEAAGERENTIVVYTSDHGEMLFQHGLAEKQTFYEDSVRVPLTMAGPGIPEGHRVASLASLVDLMPTLLDVAGLDAPDHVEGRSLRPTFDGESVRDHVYAEYYGVLDPSRMVRGERYKYVHTDGDINELYDLENDPEERTNLAFYPQYADLVDEMEALVIGDWERPPAEKTGNWHDEYEGKQRALLDGAPVDDYRPDPPSWVAAGPGDRSE